MHLPASSHIYTSYTDILSAMGLRHTGQNLHFSEQKLRQTPTKCLSVNEHQYRQNIASIWNSQTCKESGADKGVARQQFLVQNISCTELSPVQYSNGCMISKVTKNKKNLHLPQS